MVRSDILYPLRELATLVPQLREIGLPVQFRIVVDANVVFGDLHWLTSKRKKASARTNLQELIASKTVVALAPEFLDEEVREHAEEMAARAKVSVRKYLLAWEQYRESLVFVRPQDRTQGHEVDVDDVDYVAVYKEFGAHVIYSDDVHIPRMGAPVVDEEIIITLKEYSRAAGVRYSIQYGGVFGALLGWHAFVASIRALVGIVNLVCTLPRWGQGLLLTSVIALIAHPKSRAWILEAESGLGESLQSILSGAGQFILQAGAEAALKAHEAQEWLAQIEGHFGQHKKISLRVLLRALCVVEQRPMTIKEIELRVLANNYQTRAKDFTSYLRRVLRESEEFMLVQGKWTICTEYI